MDIEQVRDYCLSFDNIYEDLPFDDVTPVYKIKKPKKDKIFAILSIEKPFAISLKCQPDYSLQLQEKYDFIIPGYHLNKKHWITVYLDDCPESLLLDLIKNSYNLVKLSAK